MKRYLKKPSFRSRQSLKAVAKGGNDKPYQYLLFHKPYDVLSQFTDSQGDRATLKDFMAIPDVYPVGRLDRDSEGLLLLTNHGQLQHRLSNPKYKHPRTYWVQVERLPSPAAIAQLCQGVTIQGQLTLPAQVKQLMIEPDLPLRFPPIRYRKSVPTCWLEIVLREGRNRQVRRMTAAVGHPTLRLVRVAIGSLRLEGLMPGQWRPLTAREQSRLLAENLG
ncbi:MAG: pseudouridine synthase [Cyanobacteria bacterium P01_H01_bin.58]